jgi:hypothetical protein
MLKMSQKEMNTSHYGKKYKKASSLDQIKKRRILRSNI